MSILLSEVKGKERDGKKIIIKKQGCSVIDQVRFKKLKKKNRKRIPRKIKIKTKMEIHLKPTLNQRKHLQWQLMIKQCLLPSRDSVSLLRSCYSS
jgi:hypothetical protein